MAHAHQSKQRKLPAHRFAEQQRLAGVSQLLSLLVMILAIGTTGCARKMEAPPASALKQARQDSKLDREHLEIERRHVAPPPAYGNKVVLASTSDENIRHF